MTPTLLEEAQQHLQAREQSAYTAYKDSIDAMVSNGTDLLTAWHDAADDRTAWLNTHDAAMTAINATPCQHTTAQRSHEAQRCACCWTISTYIRVSEPKENDDD